MKLTFLTLSISSFTDSILFSSSLSSSPSADCDIVNSSDCVLARSAFNLLFSSRTLAAYKIALNSMLRILIILFATTCFVDRNCPTHDHHPSGSGNVFLSRISNGNAIKQLN